MQIFPFIVNSRWESNRLHNYGTKGELYTSTNMPKRKRSDYEESNISNLDDRRLGAQIARLEQKIEHGCQLIHRALKTARGFERQKLGRRQKTARQANETAQLSRIEEEIQALKVEFSFVYCLAIYLYISILN